VRAVGASSPHPLTLFLYDSEESERVSELKSISGSSRLPYGTLALGAEGIKNAIKTFDDACAPFTFLFCLHKLTDTVIDEFRRKSDIENERLPPIEERQPTSSNIPGATSTNSGLSLGAAAPAQRANAVPGAGAPVTSKRQKEGKTTLAQPRRR
jgi:serine/threonine-protein phosphatase 2B catalytic subunit